MKCSSPFFELRICAVHSCTCMNFLANRSPISRQKNIYKRKTSFVEWLLRVVTQQPGGVASISQSDIQIFLHRGQWMQPHPLLKVGEHAPSLQLLTTMTLNYFSIHIVTQQFHYNMLIIWHCTFVSVLCALSMRDTAWVSKQKSKSTTEVGLQS